MNEDIQQLKTEIETLKKRIEELSSTAQETQTIIENHQHQGYDKSAVIELGLGSTDNLTPASLSYGNGSPEGVISAGMGSIYTNLDGGTSLTLYVKESGSGDTGWIAK